MNILFICEEYPPAMHGGIGTFTKSLAEGLVQKGNTVVVVGIYSDHLLKNFSEEAENIKGVTVYRFHGFSRMKFKRIRFIAERFLLARKIRELHEIYNFDLLECHDSSGWLAVGSLPNIPKIIRLHGSQLYFNHELGRHTGRLNCLFETRWIKRADFIISVSEYVASKTIELVGKCREFKVIYNSVDTQEFKPQPDIIKENGLILFTGSILPKKGVDELINAFSLIAEKYPEAHLLLIGKDLKTMSNGLKYSEYILQKYPPEITRRIEFRGWFDHTQLPALLQRAEICCFPSHAEAFAIAPLEAMSVGSPVIFMKSGSGPEAIEDGISGLLCDTKNPTEIAEKLEVLLKDKELRLILGKNARSRIERLFNSDEWIEKNITFYKEYLHQFRTFQKH